MFSLVFQADMKIASIAEKNIDCVSPLPFH